MSAELGLLFDALPADSPLERYRQAIVDDNLLGKPTRSTRLNTARYLTNLYGLDPSRTIFRLLRHFWASDQVGRPMLACLAAAARDPLLRDSADIILGVPHGEAYGATKIASILSERQPGRFRPSTLHSASQNLASSWTQAGYLKGKVAKRRSRPIITPQVVAYALLLGYLAGLRGRLLLDSSWARLLDRSSAEVTELAAEASKQGWLRYKAVGLVVEITFPELLTSAEERLSHEPD